MQGVVVAAILKILFYPTTYFELVVGSHGHIACIKEAVNVSTEQYPIRRHMLTALRVWFDMRRFQSRKRSLSGNSALPRIDVRDQKPEGALTEPWFDKRRPAKPMPNLTFGLFRKKAGGIRAKSFLNNIPQCESFGIISIVAAK